MVVLKEGPELGEDRRDRKRNGGRDGKGRETFQSININHRVNSSCFLFPALAASPVYTLYSGREFRPHGFRGFPYFDVQSYSDFVIILQDKR